jgi:toxin CcdB
VPLSKVSSRPNMFIKKLTPTVEIEGANYLFMTQQLTSLPEEILSSPIGTLKDSRDLLIDAMDFAITGI